MEQFKSNYESLTSKLDGNVNLSAVLDFITYFRTDDIDLYNEFLSGYQEVGYYNTSRLIELYCKSKNIDLTDENANGIFVDLLNNIWNDNMSYHLTTSVSALNIYDNGMDPSKKEEEVLEDINSLASLLSDENRRYFLPYALDDINKYSYSAIPKLNVNYGRRPEWYLNLTLYSSGTLDEKLQKVLGIIGDESDLAKEKMVEVISKYHNLYENSSRILVVIPGLNKQIPPDIVDSFDVHSVSELNEYVNAFLNRRSRNIDAKSEKIVPSSDLMFIDTNTKIMVNYSDNYKKI